MSNSLIKMPLGAAHLSRDVGDTLLDAIIEVDVEAACADMSGVLAPKVIKDCTADVVTVSVREVINHFFPQSTIFEPGEYVVPPCARCRSDRIALVVPSTDSDEPSPVICLHCAAAQFVCERVALITDGAGDN